MVPGTISVEMVPGTIFLGKAKPGLLRGLAGVPLDPLGVSVALVATVPKSRENLRSDKERMLVGLEDAFLRFC